MDKVKVIISKNWRGEDCNILEIIDRESFGFQKRILGVLKRSKPTSVSFLLGRTLRLYGHPGFGKSTLTELIDDDRLVDDDLHQIEGRFINGKVLLTNSFKYLCDAYFYGTSEREAQYLLGIENYEKFVNLLDRLRLVSFGYSLLPNIYESLTKSSVTGVKQLVILDEHSEIRKRGDEIIFDRCRVFSLMAQRNILQLEAKYGQ